MTNDEITKEDLQNFDDKTEEEKINTLQTLYRKAAENDGDFIDDLGIEGELTVTVYDDDGEEKQVEKTEINA